jgi:alpha 1,2-mannosyltransferase
MLQVLLNRKYISRYATAIFVVVFVYLLFTTQMAASTHSNLKGTAGSVGHVQTEPVAESPAHHTPTAPEKQTPEKQNDKPSIPSSHPVASLPSSLSSDKYDDASDSLVYPGSELTHDLSVEHRFNHYQSVISIFERYHPHIERLDNYKDGVRARKKGFDDKEPIYSNEALGEFLQVSPSEIQALRDSHKATVAELPDSYPQGMYKGAGVVLVAGGRYMPTMLVTLKMLRRLSPTIPVEVFVADKNEYEPGICENILPKLGAKCVVLEDLFGKKFFEKFDIRSYQLKILAILGSSFETVIFMDSDSVPLKPVEKLLVQEPFQSYGYIIWPDYWFRTTSPYFYDIVGIELGKRVRGDLSVTDPKLVPQADQEGALPDKSSESGQIYVSKKLHYKSLLLSLYYNLHGFTAYYPLLTQGSGGEGDKETFLAAAQVLKDKHYQVKTDTRPAGRFEKEFIGSGMLQFDPAEEYDQLVLKTREEEPTKMFAHLNMFKLNLRELYTGDDAHRFTEDTSKHVRLLGRPKDNVGHFGYFDIELVIWEQCKWMACTMTKENGVTFKDWANADIDELCTKTTTHFDWLLKTGTWTD